MFPSFSSVSDVSASAACSPIATAVPRLLLEGSSPCPMFSSVLHDHGVKGSKSVVKSEGCMCVTIGLVPHPMNLPHPLLKHSVKSHIMTAFNSSLHGLKLVLQAG